MYDLWNHSLLKKFVRFLSGGGLIWGFRAGLTTVLSEFFLMDPVLAYRIGLTISFFLYFMMNLFFIFKVHDRLLWRMVKFSCVSLTFLSLDGVLMQWLHQQFHWHYFIALSTSTGLLLIVKFFVFDRLVFQKTGTPPTPAG